MRFCGVDGRTIGFISVCDGMVQRSCYCLHDGCCFTACSPAPPRQTSIILKYRSREGLISIAMFQHRGDCIQPASAIPGTRIHALMFPYEVKHRTMRWQLVRSSVDSSASSQTLRSISCQSQDIRGDGGWGVGDGGSLVSLPSPESHARWRVLK